MSNYKEASLSVTGYQRCHTIVIKNPYEQTPIVSFQEELILKKPNGTVVRDILIADEVGGTITKKIDNLTETFRVYDPVTQQRTGDTKTISDVYALIWSVYMDEALKRDANLAKQKVSDGFWEQEKIAHDLLGEQVAALEQTFAGQDQLDLAQAQALADTKTTDVEKQQVMDDYNASRAQKLAVIQDQIKVLGDNYNTAKTARLQQLALDAQAAYDAVFNG